MRDARPGEVGSARPTPVGERSRREDHMDGTATPARKREYSPPPVDGDFYRIADILDAEQRAVLKRVRDFMA